MQKLINANERLGDLDVALATTSNNVTSVSCVVADDVYAFLPNDYDQRKISYKKYFHTAELPAPVKAGICVGGVDVYYGDKLVATAPLVASESMEENYVLSFLKNMKGFLLGRFFIIFVIILVPSLSVYLYFDAAKSRHKKTSKIRYNKFY